MNLRSLEAFCLVARLGTLAQAASELRISPAAISLQIKNLEAELGINLFHHHPNKLILTNQGERFLKVANQILAELERAKEIAHGNQVRISHHSGHPFRNHSGHRFGAFRPPS